jgi:hypothetical protein
MRKLHRSALSGASSALAGLALAAGTALSAAPAGATTTALTDFPPGSSTGEIASVNSGKCLEPSRENFLGNGDPVVQRLCDGGINQTWEVTPIGAKNFGDRGNPLNLSAYRLRNSLTGLCLDDRDGVTSDGATVQQWACNTTSTTMIWGDDFFLDRDGTRLLNLRASNKRSPGRMALEVASGSTEENVPLQLFPLEDSQPAQEWLYFPQIF